LALSDRTWVEIDLEAVRANARTVAQRVAPARLLPMVKGNAYGLGAVPIARALEGLDPWGYGVVTADEGAELRESGIARRVVLVQPTSRMLEDCAKHALTPALGTSDDVARWTGMTSQPFHVSVDTGMNRGGVWWEEFAALAPRLAAAPGFEGVLTHFHSADRDPGSVTQQWDRFQAALRALPRKPAVVHVANSAAALGHPEVTADLVRPGIFLYGGVVGRFTPLPVVTWRARVCRTARVKAGETVSYGATWRAPRDVWISTLAVGYADGYCLALSSVGEVLIAGRRCRVAGAVTMDFTMVVSDEAPEPDAVATLIGSDGSESIGLEEVASRAGTNIYEILSGLGRRVERVYR